MLLLILTPTQLQLTLKILAPKRQLLTTKTFSGKAKVKNLVGGSMTKSTHLLFLTQIVTHTVSAFQDKKNIYRCIWNMHFQNFNKLSRFQLFLVC